MKDKKQTQQMIAVGVLVALCVGVFAFQMLRGKKSGPPPTPQVKIGNPATPSSVARPVGAGPNEGSAEPVVNEDSNAAMIAAAGRDPFAPGMNTSPSVHMDLPAPVRMASASTGRIPSMGSFFGLGARGDDQEPVRPLPPINPTVVPGNAGQPTGDTPGFVLTGVITGETNVAIIRLNDERHIVREGQIIDDKYTVVSITGRSVRLAWEGHSDIVLELGG